MTGKRHDFVIDYDVGFDDDGPHPRRSTSTYAARCGYSADLSGPVTDRAMFHCRQRLLLPGTCALHSLPLQDQHGLATPPSAASAGRRA